MITAAWASSTAFNTPACAQTTQFINDLMYKYHVLVPGSELGSNGTSPSGQDKSLFESGKIAMELEGDWNTTSIACRGGDEVQGRRRPSARRP